MKVGVLALQGSVSEHRLAMDQLDVETIEVREPIDMGEIEGMIMPGGESTTLRKLLINSGLWKTIADSDIPIICLLYTSPSPRD